MIYCELVVSAKKSPHLSCNLEALDQNDEGTGGTSCNPSKTQKTETCNPTVNLLQFGASGFKRWGFGMQG